MSKEAVVIVFSCDENYAPYSGVAIESIIKYKTKERNYEFFILITKVTIETIKKLESLSNEENNVKVKCVDIREIANNFKKCFHVHGRIPEEAYYRIYIPRIFKDYTRVLYLDCDIVCVSNIEEYFDLEFNGKFLLGIGVTSKKLEYLDEWGKKYYKYTKNVLKLNYNEMFASGQFLMDIQKLIEFQLENKTHLILSQAQNQNITFMLHDMDVLNIVGKDIFKRIDFKYCYLTYWDSWSDNMFEFEDDCIAVRNARDNINILHYAGPKKPWDFPEIELAFHFWECANESIFYYEVFDKLLNHRVNLLLNNGNIFSKEECKKNLLKMIDDNINNN